MAADDVVNVIMTGDPEAQVLEDGIVVASSLAIGWVKWTKTPCVLHVEPGTACHRAGVTTDDWLIEMDGMECGELGTAKMVGMLHKGACLTFSRQAPAVEVDDDEDEVPARNVRRKRRVRVRVSTGAADVNGEAGNLAPARRRKRRIAIRNEPTLAAGATGPDDSLSPARPAVLLKARTALERQQEPSPSGGSNSSGLGRARPGAYKEVAARDPEPANEQGDRPVRKKRRMRKRIEEQKPLEEEPDPEDSQAVEERDAKRRAQLEEEARQDEADAAARATQAFARALEEGEEKAEGNSEDRPQRRVRRVRVARDRDGDDAEGEGRVRRRRRLREPNEHGDRDGNGPPEEYRRRRSSRYDDEYGRDGRDRRHWDEDDDRREHGERYERRRGREDEGRRERGGDRHWAPTREKPEKCCVVWVGYLDSRVIHDDLRRFFEGILDGGQITAIRQGSTFAHVEFSSTECVDRAVTLSGERLNGHKVRVDYARGEGARKPDGDMETYKPRSERPQNGRTIWVGDIGIGLTQADVKGFFEHCGAIEFLSVKQSPKGNNQFAHIRFKTSDGMDAAVLRSGREMYGAKIRIDYAEDKAAFKSDWKQEKETNAVWIGGLPPNTVEQDLIAAFEGCGKIELARLGPPCPDEDLLYGYIVFDSSIGADVAVECGKAGDAVVHDEVLRVEYTDHPDGHLAGLQQQGYDDWGGWKNRRWKDDWDPPPRRRGGGKGGGKDGPRRPSGPGPLPPGMLHPGGGDFGTGDFHGKGGGPPGDFHGMPRRPPGDYGMPWGPPGYGGPPGGPPGSFGPPGDYPPGSWDPQGSMPPMGQGYAPPLRPPWPGMNEGRGPPPSTAYLALGWYGQGAESEGSYSSYSSSYSGSSYSEDEGEAGAAQAVDQAGQPTQPPEAPAGASNSQQEAGPGPGDDPRIRDPYFE